MKRTPTYLAAACVSSPCWSTVVIARRSWSSTRPPRPPIRHCPAVMRDLAERLLPVYQESDPDRYLANLSALQMAAGDYVAAYASRTSLRDRRRREDSGRPVGRAMLYDFYAHAKAMEVENRCPVRRGFRPVIPGGGFAARTITMPMPWPSGSRRLPQEAEDDLQALLDAAAARGQHRSGGCGEADVGVSRLRGVSGVLAARAGARGEGGRPTLRRGCAGADQGAGPPNGSVMVVRPKRAPGRLPALLEFSIDPARDFAKEYAAHGYAGVAAYIERGPHHSHSCPISTTARRRGRSSIGSPSSPGATAAWRWYGEGYSGFTAWAAAVHAAIGAQGDCDIRAGRARASMRPWSAVFFKTPPIDGRCRSPTPRRDPSWADDGVWRALDEKWYRADDPIGISGACSAGPIRSSSVG